MVSHKKLEGDSGAYQALNISGSLLLAANTIFYGSYSFHVCKPHLGGDSGFCDCEGKASFVSLGTDPTDQLFHMRKINVKDVPEQERKSPKGKFGRFTKNISVSLGTRARVSRSLEAPSV